jgi:hypothetical protein
MTLLGFACQAFGKDPQAGGIVMTNHKNFLSLSQSACASRITY